VNEGETAMSDQGWGVGGAELRASSLAELEAEVRRLEQRVRDGESHTAGYVAYRVLAAQLDFFDAELGPGRVDALLAAAQLDAEALRSRRQRWIPWLKYQRFFEELEGAVEDGVGRRAGVALVRSPWLGFAALGVRALPRFEMALRWSGSMAAGPGGLMYRGCHVTVRRTDSRQVELRFMPPPGGFMPRLWIEIASGALEHLSMMAGAAAGAVTDWRAGEAVVFRVRHEERMASRVRAALRAVGLASMRRALEEARRDLRDQNRELQRYISELERSERERARLRPQVGEERQTEAMARFATGVAHDFNNLIGALILQIDRARRVAPGVSTRSDLAVMADAADEAARLGRELLEVGRRLEVGVPVAEADGVAAEGAKREALVERIVRLGRQLDDVRRQQQSTDLGEDALGIESSRLAPGVAGRNVPPIVWAAERLGVDTAGVSRRLGWSLEEEGRPGRWLTWSQFNALLTEIGELLGEDGARRLGRQALQTPLHRSVGLIAGALVDERDVFRWMMRLFYREGSIYFTGVEGRIEVRGPRETRAIWQSRGAEFSRAFAEAMAGIVEHAPTLMGRPPAQVRVDFHPRQVVLHITAAPRRFRLWGGARRFGLRSAQRDAEELKRIYTELVESNQRLTEKVDALESSRAQQRELEQRLEVVRRMESLGRFAAKVAHDFNNLLTVIIGLSGLLRRSLPHGSQLREEVDAIEKTAGRATALTRELRAIGSDEPSTRTTVNLVRVVEDAMPVLRRLLGPDIALETRFEHGLLCTRFDATSVERILTNLVVNARDAGAGTVAIEVESATLDDAFVAQYPGTELGDHVVLCVRDDGPGMPPSVKARIFEPYFSTKKQGDGVGLAIVYGLVRACGGTVWVDSAPGDGTVFRVFLPRTKLERLPSGASSSPASPGAALNGERRCVLLVDDNDMLRTTVARMLEMAGFDVTPASSGDEAIAVVRAGLRPAIVVSDVVMPGLRGAPLVQALREELEETPILFISGFSDQPLGADLGDDPRIGFLAKPFGAPALMDRIEAMLEAAAT
jgi:signal transduction histidine kinase/CheY-like chemotaxis protein